MNPTALFLFDLDGTLVSTGGAGLRSLSKTFFKMFGVENAHQKIDPAGKTDPFIFRELVRVLLGRESTPSEFDNLAATYLAHLKEEMKVSKTKPFNGVMEYVHAVSKNPAVAMGLGTGNLEKGARLKLEPTPLNAYFSFGGFGSDAEERADVLRAGHKRAQEKFGTTFSPDRVYIIGDTVLDIAAARKAGFKSVAVATGKSSVEELSQDNPDYAWRDMTEGYSLLEGL